MDHGRTAETGTETGAEAEAEVVAYRCSVRYRRRGSGPSVILLRPPELAGAVDAALLEDLARRFRVLVPMSESLEVSDPSSGDHSSGDHSVVASNPADVGASGSANAGPASEVVPLAERLRCFVEGMGLLDGALLAVGRYRAAALALASSLPDQITRVVLLYDVLEVAGAIDAPWSSPPHAHTSEAIAVPLLEITYDAGRMAWQLPHIVSFLERGDGAATA